MKAVLLFFLNSLEIVVVLTQTGRPATECQLTKAGHEYAGTQNVTRSGRTCQRWDSDQPHQHKFKNSTLFPEGNAVAAGNKCRNPDIKHTGGVWCYTTDPNTRWEACDVNHCGCKTTMAGREYDGTLSVTRSGLTCQRWDSDQPHYNNHTNSTLFPEGSAVAAGNKCRNPDSSNTKGVWCYTTDPNTRWEECDVDYCGIGCKLTKAGHEYDGLQSVTRSGRTCQRWSSDQPHSNNFKNSTLFPEGNAVAAGNKCRNPDKDHSDGVWCYTTDPNTRWEECDVSFCGEECKLTNAGHEYAGLLSVTRSGLTCQRWDSDQPHSNNFKNSTLFPEGDAVAAGNKCRNPNKDHNDGVWCYTTDPNTRWEECDVDFCDCKTTKSGREYAGPLNVTRSGLACQSWDSDQPHSNRFKDSTLFPEGSALAADNKCRNPDMDHYEGVWCYTTDPNTRWEDCDVDYCQTQSTPQSSTKNLTTIRPRSTTGTTQLSPSTNVATRSIITLSSPLPQETISSPNENASTSIVVIILSIVGVIAVVCVIVVVIIIIWKRKGCFQSHWRSLVDEGSTSSRSKRKKNIEENAIYKPSDNPDDVNFASSW